MECLKDFLPGGTLGGLYFGYVKEWWPFRHEPNVLLLHYADAKKDLFAEDSGAEKKENSKIQGGGASTLQSGRRITITRGVNLDNTYWEGENLNGVAFQQSVVRSEGSRLTSLLHRRVYYVIGR